jgi:hypothetical protein
MSSQISYFNGIERRKFLLFVVFFGLSIFFISLYISIHIFGGSAFLVSSVLGITAGYIILTEPLRIRRLSRILQSSETPLFSSFINVASIVSGSRTRPIILIDQKQFSFSQSIKEAKRAVLLGYSLEKSLEVLEKNITSSSLLSALKTYRSKNRGSLALYDEYTQQVLDSMLSYETKVPIFVAVVFFAPILLTFFVITAHLFSPVQLIYMILLDILIVDIGFLYSSSERKMLQ